MYDIARFFLKQNNRASLIEKGVHKLLVRFAFKYKRELKIHDELALIAFFCWEYYSDAKTKGMPTAQDIKRIVSARRDNLKI